MNTSNLITSISGLRGETPEPLSVQVVYDYVTAFATISPNGPIVVSRDSRKSGHELKKTVIQALQDAGRDILDIDLAPLPTTQIAVELFKAAGAIDITASHNPLPYNGLKFLGSDGIFIDHKEWEEIKEIVQKGVYSKEKEMSKNNLQLVQSEVFSEHIQRVSQFVGKGKKLIIAVDAVNGAGSEILKQFLENINCEVLPIAMDPSQDFPHTPEPIPQNLQWTKEQLQGKKFDLCVVVDPDADRLVLIDESGAFINEEATLPLVATELMEQGRRGKIVLNMSTSQMTETVAKEYDVSVVRSKVGEVNVVRKMQREAAFLGGEGSGGIIDPSIHYGRDSLVGIALVISLLRRSEKRISQLVALLPRYEMRKEKYQLDPKKLPQLYANLERMYPDAEVNTEDGLRLSWPDQEKWLHVRPSNTEPIVRAIAEAKKNLELDTLLILPL